MCVLSVRLNAGFGGGSVDGYAGGIRVSGLSLKMEWVLIAHVMLGNQSASALRLYTTI